MVVLESEPRSSARKSALNHWANSSAPQIQTFYLKLWEIIVHVNNIKYQYSFRLTVAPLFNEPLYWFFSLMSFHMTTFLIEAKMQHLFGSDIK